MAQGSLAKKKLFQKIRSKSGRVKIDNKNIVRSK